MFELKKIISMFITIPGAFIFILFLTGICSIRKKIYPLLINILIGLVLYCASISFFANPLVGLVEMDLMYNGTPKADAIILLGGGVSEGVADLSGTGTPAPDMLVRAVDAVRLYREYRLPVIMTGGSSSEGVSEASVVQRYLADLGVSRGDIILEDRSRDTAENAAYVKKIFTAKKFRRGVLVTSGYHLKRAMLIFGNTGIDVLPHACGLLSEKKEKYTMYDFMPNICELRKSAIAVRESVGMMFYAAKYRF